MNEFFHTTLRGSTPFQELGGLHQYATQNSGLGKNLTTLLYKKGEAIYEPGRPFPGICEVVSGAVRISNLTEAGEEVTTEILSQTDLFGNLKALPDNHSEVAYAMVDCVICVYQAEYLTRLIAEEPLVSGWYSHYLLQRWQSLEKRLVRISSCKVIDNVFWLDQRFNHKVRDAQGREQVLRRLLTQKDMADLIGTTRQTVSIAMKEIKRSSL